jgi:subtilisin family serine protease
MWINTGEIAGNGLDDDGDGYIDNIHGIDVANNDGAPDDDHSHGTHVAGTIGAAANDSNLCVGVAWNVRLMACKFLDERGYGYTSDAVKCIDFAVSKGARILNCSWGSSGSSEAIREALKRAGENGAICVAAAGNSGVDTDQHPHYPSSYDLDNIISVAAIDRNGQLASWSNYGQTTVDITAPGVEILSSVADSDSSYAYYSGTSMATPHVVGIAALMLANDPELTAGQLKSGILNTSVLLDNLDDLCVTSGLANANNALQGGGDGELEAELTASKTPLIGGQSVLFFVRVTDVDPITDAVVTGTAMEATLSFSDDGTNGDVNAEDGIYTTAFVAPTDASVTQLTLRVSATAPGYSSAIASAKFTVLHSPPNDNFADCITITGSRARFADNNLGATAEKGEPRHYFWKAQCSVWYEWTAPTTGLAMVTTRGSNFDTVMAVYTGDNLASLRRIARDDDRGGNLTSRVRFWARAGKTYQIAIDGYRGEEGRIKGRLRLTRPKRYRPRR